MTVLVHDVEEAVRQFTLRQQLRTAGLPLLIDAGTDFAQVVQATKLQSTLLTGLAEVKARNLARRGAA